MGFLSDLVKPVTSVLSDVAPIFSGIMGAVGQKETNQSNVELSREQMDFQERMSNTAHQREVEDLIKAGLNPILSVSRGASTPQGSMPVMMNPYASGISAASQAASIRKTSAEADTEEFRTVVAKTEAEQAKWMFNNVQRFLEEKLAQTNYLTDEIKERVNKVKQEIVNLAKEGELIDEETANKRIHTVLSKYAIPEAKLFADFFSSEVAKSVPYLREASGAVSSAAKLFQMTPAGRTFYRGK